VPPLLSLHGTTGVAMVAAMTVASVLALAVGLRLVAPDPG
jgi:hypothetical protein